MYNKNIPLDGKPLGNSGVGILLHFKNVINELKSLSFKSENYRHNRDKNQIC